MAGMIFWISFLVISYVYVGYPLLLLAWRGCAGKPVRRADWEPAVSIVIAAYNERENIESKILNCLELDYPRDKLEIIVSLDGPTDGTDVLACKYVDHGIRVICCPSHRGKAAALNAGLAEVSGEVIVFADARQRIERRAIRELVADLNDPTVGAVTGRLVLLDDRGEPAADGVGLYWRYETRLRALESDIHSVAGATGALYAIRREHARPIPPDTILDDVLIPLRAVLAGRRIVYQPRALVYEPAVWSPEIEFRRKIRTLMGNYQLLAYLPEVLLPTRNPIFLQFLSHKVGRLVVPYLLGALFLSNLLLARSPVFLALFVLQVLFYLSAAAGCFIARQGAADERRPAPLERSRVIST